MVLRHPACVVCFIFLALGLQRTTARIIPRFVLGNRFPGSLGEATAQQREEADLVGSQHLGGSLLRLGEGDQSLMLKTRIGRQGAWGLTVVRGTVVVNMNFLL